MKKRRKEETREKQRGDHTTRFGRERKKVKTEKKKREEKGHKQ